MSATFYITLASAYLIGGIPTGYIVAMWQAGIDVTQNGSGNSGATNVARLLGKKRYFFLILLLDACKAYGVLWFAQTFLHVNGAHLVSLACALLVGNGFSLFLGLRGGKGVATSYGILLFFLPFKAALCFAAWWVSFLVIFRRVDSASILSMFAGAACATWYFHLTSPLLPLVWFIAVWVLLRHHRNIKYLLWGE